MLSDIMNDIMLCSKTLDRLYYLHKKDMGDVVDKINDLHADYPQSNLLAERVKYILDKVFDDLDELRTELDEEFQPSHEELERIAYHNSIAV